ncbi:phage minor head protein [Shinella sp. HZN7]|uniref:phage head morphogenesis protein n=1 Tax=Shinella sp. (strain HZN7) TaxID=879274 RepID=UPI0007DA9A5F|nr:phage minor head protein [Shinella sp. HZN7]ANH04611.1 hypothetical protein shn_11565 [Shinella sp. HZN7]
MTTTLGAIDLPFDEAIDFLRQKTAVPTKSWREVWDGAHSKMFMVAGANSKAIVDDFQAAILKAATDGTTLKTFQDDFDVIVKKHGWSYRGERGWRTRTIFETNMRTAYAAGRYAQLTAPDTLATFPFWQYNHSGALHPRLQHKDWNGLCLAADDPAWSVMYPPNGFGCGCFVTPVSRPGLRRKGKASPDRAPDLDQLGTDQPLGVDPSFAYNPGQAWLQQTAPGPKPVTADEATVAAFVVSALRGKWPDGSWTPVAVVPKAQATVLDVAAGAEVRLTAETIRDLDKGTLATPAELGVIPRWLVKHGDLVKEADGGWAFVGEYEGRTYRARVDIIRTGSGRTARSHLKLLDVRPVRRRARK